MAFYRLSPTVIWHQYSTVEHQKLWQMGKRLLFDDSCIIPVSKTLSWPKDIIAKYQPQ
jgi:hypothetical protein